MRPEHLVGVAAGGLQKEPDGTLHLKNRPQRSGVPVRVEDSNDLAGEIGHAHSDALPLESEIQELVASHIVDPFEFR